MAASKRRPDDQFPMMMGKELLCEYLGPSSPIIDEYIELGLDKAIKARSKKDGRPLFSRPLVDKWLNTTGY